MHTPPTVIEGVLDILLVGGIAYVWLRFTATAEVPWDNGVLWDTPFVGPWLRSRFAEGGADGGE